MHAQFTVLPETHGHETINMDRPPTCPSLRGYTAILEML